MKITGGFVSLTPLDLRRSEFAEAVRQKRLIVIFRKVPAEIIGPAMEALIAAGVVMFEFTLDDPKATTHIRTWRRKRNIFVGAGTVISLEDVQKAVAASAQFVVSPVYRRDMMVEAFRHHLPVIPGCLSPSEIYGAWYDAEATFVKLFPGALQHEKLVRSLQGPFPEIPLVVTGGTNPWNARQIVDAGASAVGVNVGDLSNKGIVVQDMARGVVADLQR